MAGGGWIDALVPAEALAAAEEVGPVEVLVGVHALNQARSVVRVVEAAAAGLAKHLSVGPSAVLVADAGSGDGTSEAVQAWAETAPGGPPIRCIRLQGAPSRGHAILAILAAARRLGVSACGVVDAGLVGMTPEGIERLLHPALAAEAECVTPAYTHAASEGTLTTNLLAPLTRALYGVRVQQVVGGCAALGRDLLGRLLEGDGLEPDLAEHGVEIWLAVAPLASGARVAEAHLGQKVIDAGLAPPDLATTLARTVGPFFRLMERYGAVWPEIRGSASVSRTGDASAAPAGAGSARVDRMVHAFRLGLKDLLPVWEQVLSEETLAHLYPLGLLAPDEFRFAPGVWARVVSEFALGYHERRLTRDHLLRALTPLYLGRVAAFLGETQAGPPARTAEVLEAVGRAFEAEKEYLAARWR